MHALHAKQVIEDAGRLWRIMNPIGGQDPMNFENADLMARHGAHIYRVLMRVLVFAASVLYETCCLC